MNEVELVAELWPSGSGPDAPQVFCLIDGARDDGLVPALRLSRLPHQCLYAGPLSAALAAAAPHLVHLNPVAPFLAKLATEGWGRAWCIFATARPDVSLQQLARHFRRFLRVQDDAGRKLLFRFYDPRVLRPYLAACNGEETSRLLGPMTTLACESADGGRLLRWSARPSAERGRADQPIIVRDAQMAALADHVWRRFCVEAVPALVAEQAEMRPDEAPLPAGVAEARAGWALERARLSAAGDGETALLYARCIIAYGPCFDRHPAITALRQASQGLSAVALEEFLAAAPNRFFIELQALASDRAWHAAMADGAEHRVSTHG